MWSRVLISRWTSPERMGGRPGCDREELTAPGAWDFMIGVRGHRERQNTRPRRVTSQPAVVALVRERIPEYFSTKNLLSPFQYMSP
jgi:hypothetical protein